MNFTDTIAAIATGNVISAIGIVRISGAESLTAADNIFRVACGIKLKDVQAGKMYYGEVVDTQGETIDLCLCAISRAPKSYTGEDTVEFHCHGSPVVLSEVLQALIAQGVRLAEAGEFTKRAFLSGRMDLTQAEAVIDLIEAETPQAARNAAGQLQGAVCKKMDAIYDRLVDIMAHFHAVIDYPDEDIDEFALNDYLKTLKECEDELRRLLDTHERGKVLRSGIPTAIIGRTNTGKSSLLNALLGYERAIVTDVHGTTRDTIEEKVLVGGVLLRLIDTAGLRKTEDTVEKLGLERTMAALKDAQLILAVFDGSEPMQDDDYAVLQSLPQDTPAIIIINKCDKIAQKDSSCSDSGCSTVAALSEIPLKSTHCLNEVRQLLLSAKTGEGLDRLITAIQTLFPNPNTTITGEIITSTRQAEALRRAADSIHLAQQSLTAAVSPDAVLTDIEATLSAIGEITGKTMREDIISRIFDRFCVGK